MVKNNFKYIAFGLIACFWALPLYAGTEAPDYTEGFEYRLVSPPQPTQTGDKIEVLEMFWYGCPHCYKFEPQLSKWVKTLPKNVKFIRMPAVLGKNWAIHAQAYFTAEDLGIVNKIHRPLFDAIHIGKRKLMDEDSLRAFFMEQGVSREDFDNTFRSFSVQHKLKRAIAMSRRYGIRSVPSMVVNGKYRTNADAASINAAGGPRNENMLKVVRFLIDKESKGKPGKK